MYTDEKEEDEMVTSRSRPRIVNRRNKAIMRGAKENGEKSKEQRAEKQRAEEQRAEKQRAEKQRA